MKMLQMLLTSAEFPKPDNYQKDICFSTDLASCIHAFFSRRYFPVNDLHTISPSW